LDDRHPVGVKRTGIVVVVQSDRVDVILHFPFFGSTGTFNFSRRGELIVVDVVTARKACPACLVFVFDGRVVFAVFLARRLRKRKTIQADIRAVVTGRDNFVRECLGTLPVLSSSIARVKSR
jgi:hypothetical protein